MGQIEPPDLINFHQQESNRMYKGVLQSSTSERKMMENALKINKQMKQERIATKENQKRVIDLERKIIALGIDPTVMEDLVKQKDTEIKVLKKKPNLLEARHVQTLELQASCEEIE
jgi:trehalose-6-phosphate synthase